MSVFVTYPLDVIRVRMAFQTKSPGQHAPPTFTQAYKQIYQEHTMFPASTGSQTIPHRHYIDRFPILKFYRGFSVTIAGMIPYAGVSFLSWGFLRAHFLPPDKAGHRPPTPVADLTIGAVSGMIAQTASYPFEIVRRRMQVGGITRPDRWLRLGETVGAVWQSGGWRGFYVGLTIGYLKVVPMTASALNVDRNAIANILALFARPAPARPPNAPALPSSEQTIQQLLTRIASLEKALGEQKGQQSQTKTEPVPDGLFLSSPSSSSTFASTGNPSPYASPAPDTHPPPSPPADPRYEEEEDNSFHCTNHLSPTTYASHSALAHLSVGHHGEYIGRGSLVCALHSISTGKHPRFLYAKSTDSTCAYRAHSRIMSNSLMERLEDLIRNIPPMSIMTALLQAFFRESNWRFGVPEDWFYTACGQMWAVLEYPGPHGMQINPNWLSLLFAMLAYAPKASLAANGGAVTDPDHFSDHAFSCAMAARRIAEDDYMNKPNLSIMVSAADGVVLACLAVPLLCSYLSQRGRVSEAWKLVGNGLRNAISVGMHRDPEWRQWQVMSKDEILLRRRAWWGLYIWDKMYSYLLGRPQMIRQEMFDVAVPNTTDLEGSRTLFDLGQVNFIQLAALAGEIMDACFGVAHPDIPLFFEMDKRLEHWERSLPPEYQLPRDEGMTRNLTTTELLTVNHQRYALHTWYLLFRTKIHIAALTGVRTSRQRSADILASRDACVLVCMRLIRLQCDNHDYTYRAEEGCTFPGSVWSFEGCFSLFEASVALLTTLTRYPWESKIREADSLVTRAIDVLTHVAGYENGKRSEIPRMAATVLGSLQEESWWQAQLSNKAPVTPPLPHEIFEASPHSNAYIALQSQAFDAGYEYFASMTNPSLFPPNLINQIPSAGQPFCHVSNGSGIFLKDGLREDS
ncbi:hypothetical protein H0H81_001590 [Sphagnurus paluster]|uniref:Xylanolytic transcriptional activator regulatory domain-containing protein n=1 Tax=Sphagnurus paluster TaxID=117069 RepID=A0A9P7FZW3_9AGAR|nr:hypothetical protein H0H81_001590 [Sphagnurus paluster]